MFKALQLVRAGAGFPRKPPGSSPLLTLTPRARPSQGICIFRDSFTNKNSKSSLQPLGGKTFVIRTSQPGREQICYRNDHSQDSSCPFLPAGRTLGPLTEESGCRLEHDGTFLLFAAGKPPRREHRCGAVLPAGENTCKGADAGMRRNRNGTSGSKPGSTFSRWTFYVALHCWLQGREPTLSSKGRKPGRRQSQHAPRRWSERILAAFVTQVPVLPGAPRRVVTPSF